MPQVTYTHPSGQTRTVTGEDGQTILQIALANGVEMEHACGGNGFCTTCICEVKDGEAKIANGAISPVNDREENMGLNGPGERLGCQAQVFGDIEVTMEE